MPRFEVNTSEGVDRAISYIAAVLEIDKGEAIKHSVAMMRYLLEETVAKGGRVVIEERDGSCKEVPVRW